EDRLAMLRLALSEAGASEGAADRIAIWTDEIDRERWAAEAGAEARPSYMVDTLRRAARAVGRGGAAGEAAPSLTLLIGADQALAFHCWAECREVLRLAEVVVMPRG